MLMMRPSPKKSLLMVTIIVPCKYLHEIWGANQWADTPSPSSCKYPITRALKGFHAYK